jgi:uncharacterized membrane protein
MKYKFKEWHAEAIMYVIIITVLFFVAYKLIVTSDRYEKKYLELLKLKAQNERFRDTNRQ